VRDDAFAAVAWVRERLPYLTSGRVLDVGCGEGTFLRPGAVGLDIDVARLRAARVRSPLVVAGDVRALPFAAATFGTAYAHRMLNDTGDADRALAEIARVLRDDGRLVVFTRARPPGAQAEAGTGGQVRGSASPDRASARDRLDRWNGEARLRRHFADVRTETPALDDRAALFIAARPLRGDRAAMPRGHGA